MAAPSTLHVVSWIAERYGGPPRNVRDVTAGLAARGDRVVVLSTDRDGRSRLQSADRSALDDSHEWVLARVPTWGPAVSPEFVRLAREQVGAVDLVHLHGIYSPATAIVGMIARRRGAPYVLQLHGAATDYDCGRKRWKKEPYDALVQRRLVAGATAVLAMTQMEADQGLTAYPNARMRIVPPPIVEDAPGDEIEAGGRSRGGGGRGPTIGFLSRISQKKGAPILLDAFARLASEFPDARLVVAGPDDEGIGARMEREVERLGLGDRVSFPGMVVGPEKVAMLADFDIFALPSADESFGIAVVEAMHAGVPVVITENVAIVDEVLSAEAGISAPRTTEGFSEALRRLLRDPELAARMGAAGRVRALERYSRTLAVEAMVEVYEEAISRRPSIA